MQLDTEAEVDTEVDADTQADVDVDSEAEIDAEAEMESEAETEVDADGDTKADSEVQAEAVADIENTLDKNKGDGEDKSKLIPKSTLDVAMAIKQCEAASSGQPLDPNQKHRFVLNTKTNDIKEVDTD